MLPMFIEPVYHFCRGNDKLFASMNIAAVFFNEILLTKMIVVKENGFTERKTLFFILSVRQPSNEEDINT
jgi:hypothetical protein